MCANAPDDDDSKNIATRATGHWNGVEASGCAIEGHRVFLEGDNIYIMAVENEKEQMSQK